MKKFLMLTAFSAALLLTACGGRTDSSTPDTGTNAGRDEKSSGVADDAGDLFSDVAQDGKDIASDVIDDGREAASDVIQGGKDIASDVADGARDMFDDEDGTDDGNYRTDEDGSVKST